MIVVSPRYFIPVGGLANLLDVGTKWSTMTLEGEPFEGRDRVTGQVYTAADGNDAFVKAFVAAWTKAIDADRFDLARS